MRILIKHLLIICLLIAQGAVCAEETSPVFMPESEDKEVIYVAKKTGEERSRLCISLKKTSRGNITLYKTSATGKGAYDKYQDVTWETEAEMEQRENLLYPLYSITIVQETIDHVSIKHEKRFDYDSLRLTQRSVDSCLLIYK